MLCCRGWDRRDEAHAHERGESWMALASTLQWKEGEGEVADGIGRGGKQREEQCEQPPTRAEGPCQRVREGGAGRVGGAGRRVGG